MMDDRILTLHPDENKAGVNISQAKYDQMRESILSVLNDRQELTFSDLGEAVGERLEGRFDGSIGWYYTTVKLDLEAQGIIERAGRGSPQRIRLKRT